MSDQFKGPAALLLEPEVIKERMDQLQREVAWLRRVLRLLRTKPQPRPAQEVQHHAS